MHVYLTFAVYYTYSVVIPASTAGNNLDRAISTVSLKLISSKVLNATCSDVIEYKPHGGLSMFICL